MFFRSVDLMKPRAFADSASFLSDDAIGSSVNVMLLNDDATSDTSSAFPEAAPDALGDELLGLGRDRSWIKVDRGRQALQQVRHDAAGCERRGSSWSRRGSWSRTLPWGHRSARSPGSCRRLLGSLVAYGSGTHAPSIAGLERGDGRGVVLRDDRDVAAAGRGRRSPFDLSQVRSATSWCCRATASRASCP